MKKIMIMILAGSVCLSSCGRENNVGVDMKNEYYECYENLDAGEWENSVLMFEEKLGESGGNKDYIGLIGLAKSQIQAGRMEEAKNTLLEIRATYPEETNVLYYLGFVYSALEDYSDAAEIYRQFVLDSEENELLIEKLLEMLWKTEDSENIYEVSRELYLKYPDNKQSLQNYLKACALFHDKKHEDDLLSVVKGSKGEYVVNTLIRAYHMADSGDNEGARSLLFDVTKSGEFAKPSVNLFYGGIEDGEFDGLTVASEGIFGYWGAGIGMRNKEGWHGAFEGWYGSTSDTTTKRNGKTYEGVDYRSFLFEGNWVNGKPEGSVKLTYIQDKQYTDLPERNHTSMEETEFYFSEGKAEGRAETYFYDLENGEKIAKNYVKIHEYKKGKAQAFSMDTEDGKKMVYEFTQYNDGDSDYTELNCGCAYEW